VPSYEEVSSTSSRVIDPNHGNTFVSNLGNTVGKNDYITLVEGFSDWPENAAMWRTEVAPYATTHRDYPSQDINILRRYSQIIDGVDGPTITVPDTGGWQNWQTISAGTFQFNPGTYHTVQIQYLTGNINTNWWQATTS
jgi:hypothetical protein